MSFLFNCGLMCSLISVWGALQLGVMSIFYFTESVGLIEDCEAHGTKNYSEFIEKTKKNYKATGTNCLLASLIYVVTLLLSTGCIWRARKQDRLKTAHLEDDEISCLPLPIKPDLMVKEQQKTSIVAKILGKKGKKATASQSAQKKPFGAIDSKNIDSLKEEKKVEEKPLPPVEEIKKKKKKKDKDKKKKTKSGQD